MKRNDRHIRGFRRPRVRLDKPIVLVGMMGVGKTTIGRRLAKSLHLEFVDCDQAIEEAAGMSVAEIFEYFGEEEFRAGERRVMERLIEGPARVVATGGGAFVNSETRALIKNKAISVWLDAEIDVLVERTGRRDTRPLLRGVDRAQVLTDLFEKRRPFYAEADLQVESSVGPHVEVVRRIIGKVRHFVKSSRSSASRGNSNQPDQEAPAIE